MKKLLKLSGVAIVLVLLAVILTGCGENSEVSNTENNNVKEDVTTTKTISRGKWENNIYTNEFAEIKFNLPEDWAYSSDEEIAKLMNVGAEMLNGNEFAKIVEQTSVYDMVANNPNTGSSVMIMFEKPLISASLDFYISKIKEQLEAVETIDYTISDKIEKETLSGKEYSVVIATVPDYNMVQKYYIRQENGCFIDILVTYINNTNDEQTIMNSFK